MFMTVHIIKHAFDILHLLTDEHSLRGVVIIINSGLPEDLACTGRVPQ